LATGFSENRVIYAASDSPGGGVFRLVVGQDANWQPLGEGLPPGAMFNGLAVSESGVVYATNFQQLDSSLGRGGLERAFESSAFSRLAEGLEPGATLWGLWTAAGRLWSIDTTHNKVVTLNDTLASAPHLVSPADGARIEQASGVPLDWETLEGANGYQWQLDDDRTFANPLAGAAASSEATLPALVPATYYWRVRVAAPLPGPWSSIWSFSVVSPPPVPESPPTPAVVSLISPVQGATGVSLRPLFLWMATTGASGYELLVSKDIAFQLAAISQHGLLANGWQAEIDLEYGTTYYWRVRLLGGDWSSAGFFTTLLPPVAPIVETSAVPLVIPLNSSGGDGTIYALIFLGGVIALLLVAVLFVLLSPRRRPKNY